MEDQLYDYRKYDQIWKRVNPQENPYPDAHGGMLPQQGDAAPAVCQALLREELRHMQAVLHALENALA